MKSINRSGSSSFAFITLVLLSVSFVACMFGLVTIVSILDFSIRNNLDFWV